MLDLTYLALLAALLLLSLWMIRAIDLDARSDGRR